MNFISHFECFKLKEFKARSQEAKIVYYERTGVTKLSPQIKESISIITKKRDEQYTWK